MARVYPQTSTSSSSFSSTNPYITMRRETFTLWMKSLVYHGNGCTVFDSKGNIIYRIDNYNRKCSKEVYLMDLQGKVLFSIRQKKLQVFGHWNGYKWSNDNLIEIPWFQVKKNGYVLWGDYLNYDVTLLGFDEAETSCYKIVGLQGKSEFKIVSRVNKLIAEVKQKKSSCGVQFGNDVLSLVVEPHIDHSLVMALVTVYGLIQQRL
ncbi:protein LURP-one-related 11-like [Nicotiana tabacum]|uniref:Protein LURP-one-related 11-like n=2 Tax=Nicotiana TaxID=4085 RepID=A0A1S4CY02_TOBAC|nr:PREDICTED: protein LURP-one-related 11-like [Nicotiana sylvestris]XP_016506001.1 PREDICTED: protein LURP-one-related 11-like [Nicotiana tabacum]